MLNYHLFQKLKLVEKGKFNHLINTLTLLHTCGLSNYILIGEAQHVKYLIEIKINIKVKSREI
jgi:hypothetical protein